MGSLKGTYSPESGHLEEGDHTKEELHPKPKLSMFCLLSQNYQHFFLKNDMLTLKQIVWEMQKLYYNFSRPSSTWIIDQNKHSIVWSITQELIDLLRFECHFWVSQTNCFRMLIILMFFKDTGGILILKQIKGSQLDAFCP